MRGNSCYVLRKQVVRKTLFQLIYTKFMASENHVLPFFKILLPLKATFSSSEDIIFNESFIPTSGNLFSV